MVTILTLGSGKQVQMEGESITTEEAQEIIIRLTQVWGNDFDKKHLRDLTLGIAGNIIKGISAEADDDVKQAAVGLAESWKALEDSYLARFASLEHRVYNLERRAALRPEWWIRFWGR